VYSTDVTDAQWKQVTRLIPVPAWMAGRGGRPEGYCHREMIDAVLYLDDNGTKWGSLPVDLAEPHPVGHHPSHRAQSVRVEKVRAAALREEPQIAQHDRRGAAPHVVAPAPFRTLLTVHPNTSATSGRAADSTGFTSATRYPPPRSRNSNTGT
jgi:transposase